MPAANPCHAHAGSLTEAWELTEACLLEEGALRFLAQRLAVGAVAVAALVHLLLLVLAAVATLRLQLSGHDASVVDDVSFFQRFLFSIM